MSDLRTRRTAHQVRVYLSDLEWRSLCEEAVKENKTINQVITEHLRISMKPWIINTGKEK